MYIDKEEVIHEGGIVMYARTVRFVLGPETKWEAEHIANVLNLLLQRQPGYVRATYLMDYEVGEYVWTVFWKTKDDIERSYEHLYPEFKKMIGDQFQWGPVIQVFEVYTPTDYMELDME